MTVDSAFLENAGAVNHARDFRRFFAGVFLSEGVLGATDLDVTQRGAGANMSVDVAAGKCLISDAQSVQGLYPLVSDATTNLAIASNSSGSTRIDIVVARVKDTEYGDASNAKTIEIVQGTAGAGVPATPTRCLKLAEVTVASGAASITNANIAESRVWAGVGLGPRGQLGTGSSTATNGVTTTVVDVNSCSTGAITTVAGRRYRYSFTMPVSGSTAGNIVVLAVYKDGSTLGNNITFPVPASGVNYPVTFWVEDAPTAGSHTYKLRCQMYSGTGTISVAAGGAWSFDDIGEQTIT